MPKSFEFGQHTVRASEVFFLSKLSLGLVNLKVSHVLRMHAIRLFTYPRDD